jgi:DNA mismatch endonuclease (patch repair protein)
MADVFSVQKRSEVMSRIRGRGNERTEGRLAALFRELLITGWRRHRPLFGHPDFLFPQRRIAVFVDGCFWHGCSRHYKAPAQNGEFWNKKRDANQARDRLVNRTLRERGWRVLRIWEHELRGDTRPLRQKLRRWFGTARVARKPGSTDR